MKRNKLKARAGRSGSSPYAKYGKRPFQYSAELRAWQRHIGRRENAFETKERENVR